MRAQKMKRLADLRRALLVGIVLSTMWAAVGMAMYAAQGGPAGKPHGEQATILDPFSLETIVVSDMPPGQGSIHGKPAVPVTPTPPIHIPDRPLLRSVFRPFR